MENLSRVFQKQTNKKTHMKRLSFITQFKIEFLLPFTGCRKVLAKMPALLPTIGESTKYVLQLCNCAYQVTLGYIVEPFVQIAAQYRDCFVGSRI